MSELKQFRLPDVGEGLTEAEILRWCVRVGDVVRTNQTIVEVESAKAAVELPSPFDGVVTELHADEGEVVPVGAPLITVAVGADAAAGDAPAPAAEPVRAPAESRAPVESQAAASASSMPPGGREAVLVGYGVRAGAVTRRPRRPSSAGGPANAPKGGGGAVKALAKPPVRKLARDLGVDLGAVRASGAGGVVTREDVRAAAGTAPAVAAALAGPVPTGEPQEERIAVRGVRRATADAMVRSAFTAPHAGLWVTVDATRTLRLVDKLRRLPEYDGVKVSPLLLLARAVLIAVRRHPQVNAAWDEAAGEIVVKRQVNLGIAAATPRGLVVPNIKGAQDMSLSELARALDGLVRAARDGGSSPADLTGGTMTITNVGVFGMEGGTPILNPGEAAILAVGAIAERPWVVKDAEGRSVIEPRHVVTLCVSFDHRLIDGELGGRFLADVAAVVEDPELGVAWG